MGPRRGPTASRPLIAQVNRDPARAPGAARQRAPCASTASTTTSCIAYTQGRPRTGSNVDPRGREPRPAARAVGLDRPADLGALGPRAAGRPFEVHDLLSGARLLVAGPAQLRRSSTRRDAPAHVFRVRSGREGDAVTRTVTSTAPAPDRRRRRTRSGTRTRSSTSCTSAPSATATATASATSAGLTQQARLPAGPRRHRASGCCRSTRRRCATTATTSPTTRDVHPAYGTLRDFQALPARGPRAAACA